MNTEGGYTRQYRRVWDNPVFRNKQEAAVFTWMKDVAQWKDARISTKFGPVSLEVGELLIAERTLAEDFNLHRNTLRALIQRMSDDGMIEVFRDRCPHRAGTVVRVVNYKQYQGVEEVSGPKEDRKKTESGTEEGPKEDRKRTKNKEGNTGKEGKEERGGGAPVADAPVAPTDQPSDDLFAAADEPAPPSKVVKLPKGSRLSVDWMLPVEWESWAADKGAPPDVIAREAEKFRDYWHAKAGADARKADWYATWRTWMRRTLENPNFGDRHGAHRQTQQRDAGPRGWAAAAFREAESRH